MVDVVKSNKAVFLSEKVKFGYERIYDNLRTLLSQLSWIFCLYE